MISGWLFKGSKHFGYFSHKGYNSLPELKDFRGKKGVIKITHNK